MNEDYEVIHAVVEKELIPKIHGYEIQKSKIRKVMFVFKL